LALPGNFFCTGGTLRAGLREGEVLLYRSGPGGFGSQVLQVFHDEAANGIRDRAYAVRPKTYRAAAADPQ